MLVQDHNALWISLQSQMMDGICRWTSLIDLIYTIQHLRCHVYACADWVCLQGRVHTNFLWTRWWWWSNPVHVILGLTWTRLTLLTNCFRTDHKSVQRLHVMCDTAHLIKWCRRCMCRHVGRCRRRFGNCTNNAMHACMRSLNSRNLLVNVISCPTQDIIIIVDRNSAILCAVIILVPTWKRHVA